MPSIRTISQWAVTQYVLRLSAEHARKMYSFCLRVRAPSFDYGNTAIEKRSIFYKQVLRLLEFGREREGVDLSSGADSPQLEESGQAIDAAQRRRKSQT